MTIQVVKPGLFTTVQDLGRYGYAHLGISPGGAADPLSFRIANLLVGNDENAPALEMTLLGPTLAFKEGAVVAIAGADCDCQVDTAEAPINAALDLAPGTVLQCGSITSGARCYLAVQGGFEVPLVMGSASTFAPGHFGGLQGRRLQKGDVLQIGRHDSFPVRSLRPGSLDALRAPGRLRVTKGSQHDWFGPDAFETLFSTAYIVGEKSDRAGLRLQGAAVRPREPSELLTDGVPLGAIQVPPDGQPIILFVDQQTTGGYPKIANVIAADVHRVGQLRPGDEVRFAEVSIAEAIQALRSQNRWLTEIFVS